MQPAPTGIQHGMEVIARTRFPTDPVLSKQVRPIGTDGMFRRPCQPFENLAWGLAAKDFPIRISGGQGEIGAVINEPPFPFQQKSLEIRTREDVVKVP